MTTLRRTNASDPHFISLVQQLDAELLVRDGQEENAFYSQFNKIHMIKQAVVAYTDGVPVGCGAIKPFDEASVEVKRMFVVPAYRNKGIAARILGVLEQWAEELGARRCLLETGTRQPEAIRLYEKNGYRRIANYGQYAGVENSLCFEKELMDNITAK